jgi:hypothetical protein
VLTDFNRNTLKEEISVDRRIILKCIESYECVLEIQVLVVGCCECGSEPSGFMMVG